MFLVYEKFFTDHESSEVVGEEYMKLHSTKESAIWDMKMRREEFESRRYTYMEKESSENCLVFAELLSTGHRLTEAHVCMVKLDVEKIHDEKKATRERKLRDVSKFLLKLSDEDIDLENKLDNMEGCEICNRVLYKFLTSDSEIQELIRARLKWKAKLFTDTIAEFVLDETEKLFSDGVISSDDDYASGFYNMDKLYVTAIKEVLNLEYDK